MTSTDTVKVQQIDAYRWRIPRQGQMQVDGLVFASAALMQAIRQDQSLQRVTTWHTCPVSWVIPSLCRISTGVMVSYWWRGRL